MKKIFLLHVSFLSAFFSFAQKDIAIATSLTYLDNYSNLQTYWRNNSVINNNGAGDPGYFGGSGYHIAADRGVNANPEPAFSSITTLNPIPIGSIDTQHKPQAKTWTYAGKWWCAIPPGSGGTWIFRLDGTTWTPILRISTGGRRVDCWVVGDLVHVLMFKGSGANAIATVQYDPGTNTYKAGSGRPTPTSVSFPTGVESATLTIDGTGRMWVAADAVNDIFVWWSDSPYNNNTWSAAINVATGISSDDICAVTKLQGKIGVFWSNQNTGLFGFKTHTDGANPTTWSADEIPASQSAIPGNPRMADDHMNLTLASNGTLYCVAKTSYNSSSLPELILLIRRPAGTWDNLYPIGKGTQAIVLLNEVIGKLKIVYTSVSNGGQILYKESPVSNISFSSAATLMGGSTANYNFSSSTHQTYNPDVAIVATNQGSPRQIVSVLASDASSGDVTGIVNAVGNAITGEPQGFGALKINKPSKVKGNNKKESATGIQATVYPNPFSNDATFSFTLSHTEKYVIKFYDSRGFQIARIDEGTANANEPKNIKIGGSDLAAGMYMVSIQTSNDIKVLKLGKNNNKVGRVSK